MIDVINESSSPKLNLVKTYKDAMSLLDSIIDNDIAIRLWDEDSDNCIISVESDPDFETYCYATYIDSVNGEESRRNEYKGDVAQNIYNHRNHVNKFIKDEYPNYM